MNKQDIQLLYKYNRWANWQTLESSAKLTTDQFTKDLMSSYRSVRDTLAHLLGAEWIWLMRWNGESPTALLNPLDFPDFASLSARWAEVERDQTAFVNGLTDESLESPVTYLSTRGEPWTYPLWQMLQHVVNHSSYHRGQVATMLRQLGAVPGPTDFLVFFDVIGRD